MSMVRLMPLSMALLFLLGDEGWLEYFLLLRAESSSVSSMRGMLGVESSILNSGCVMKLWMDDLESGFSRPS